MAAGSVRVMVDGIGVLGGCCGEGVAWELAC